MLLVPLEAVSPILSTDHRWEYEINGFWWAYESVFQTPDPSQRCGSHIHVSPSPCRRFNMSDLRSVAFGTIAYENNVFQLLPWYHQDNKYWNRDSPGS